MVIAMCPRGLSFSESEHEELIRKATKLAENLLPLVKRYDEFVKAFPSDEVLQVATSFQSIPTVKESISFENLYAKRVIDYFNSSEFEAINNEIKSVLESLEFETAIKDKALGQKINEELSKLPVVEEMGYDVIASLVLDFLYEKLGKKLLVWLTTYSVLQSQFNLPPLVDYFAYVGLQNIEQHNQSDRYLAQLEPNFSFSVEHNSKPKESPLAPFREKNVISTDSRIVIKRLSKADSDSEEDRGIA